MINEIVKLNIPNNQAVSAINKEFIRIKGVDIKQDIRLFKLETGISQRVTITSFNSTINTLINKKDFTQSFMLMGG